MIDILSAPGHVLALRMAGTVTDADLDRVIREVEARLEDHPRIGLFVDATGFEDMTAEAAAKDLRYSFGKFREWARFPREAVVTDRQWLRTLIGIANPLVPQVELRAFAPAERAQAMAWAADVAPS